MFKINVPFRSQWDADARLSKGDCGIVSAAMLCNWKGIDISPDDMLRKAKLPVGRMTYTFNEIITAARAAGLSLVHDGKADWTAILEQIKQGKPVIPLLRYGLLKANQDTFAGAHFFVVVGWDEQAQEVIVHDPNFWPPRREDGMFRRVPLSEFEAAIGDALMETGNRPHQSLFVL